MPVFSRRSAFALLLLSGSALSLLRPAAAADEKSVTIGVDLPLTGTQADTANLVRWGMQSAVDELNAKGGAGGYHLNVLMLDDGTTTAGQYDPAQAAINARKMVSDTTVVAAIGPMNSGSAKAMTPILSQGGLATITPSSTNPDLTSPKFAAIYHPVGPVIFFRTVTTDAYQGPNMANFFAETLKLKSVYILDDSGAYGVGLADAFEGQARKKGLTVLGRDRLDPKQADYSAILTKIKSLAPDALYVGADAQAGVKLMKQGYDIIPSVVKGGGDGFFGPELLTAGGFPAAEGWYSTIASPHVTENPDVAPWVQTYTDKYGRQPSDYAITAYDGVKVIADAIDRVAKTGPVTRAAVRTAIQTAKVPTLQGVVSFDENGDLASRTVSVFQIKHDEKFAAGDVIHQYKYIGVAPQE
ncbi:branched-chain amino acid ABC transporter substrate-binding protein [Acidisphaera sp. L21]|uniref:branched-chain amino acid ABC transporter substrate-binding protein n=1 Tax=Acidisphaera sp. L21 TaxID=1641851 RepID=UPI00131CAE9E|nr:branched-chain amino acid ABC transporter substrate-binding protein [Acidisphaera sp. L21]